MMREPVVHQASWGAPTEAAMHFNQPGKRRWQNKRGEGAMQQPTSTREAQCKERIVTQQERGGGARTTIEGGDSTTS